MRHGRSIRQAVWRLIARGRRRRRWTDEIRYKSPSEIALENAAESLGVTLGEYYTDDLDLRTGGSEVGWGADARADASREELLTYVDALRDKRQRRLKARRLGLLGGGVALVLVAVAVVAGATLLSGARHQVRKNATDPTQGFGGRPVISVLNAQSPLGSSVSSEVWVGTGKIINSTYLNRYGDLCSALIEFRRGISARNHAGGCLSPALVATVLRRQSAFVVSIHGLARRTVIQGYAQTRVERIAGRSRWGEIKVAITPRWTPDGGDRVGSPSIKAFLVVADRKDHGRRVKGDPLRTTLDDRKYSLLAQLRNGQVVPIGKIRSAGSGQRDRLFDPIVMASEHRERGSQDQNHRSE